jgi:Spy/CpxP family protein refolding chaperone
MNKNAVYLAVFAVLCVLVGVLVGASITKKPPLPWPCPGNMDFAQRAERFMEHGPGGPGGLRGEHGPFEMLTIGLDLNADQKNKVAGIIEKTRQEIDVVGENVRSAISKIKDNGDKQIMDILTPPQREKFQALQKEFKRGRGPNGLQENHGPMREEGLDSGDEFPSAR